MKKSTSGFTIVELLIVIVVIGILAAIAIVAYNGIQTRAQNARLLSALDTYEKALRQYKTLNAAWPAFTPPSGETLACLGGSFPATSDFALDKCYTLSGVNQASKSSQVNSALLTVLSNLPETAGYTLQYGSGTNLRGILYWSSTGGTIINGSTAYITYYIQGNQTCGRGEKQTDAIATSCTVYLGM